MKGPANDRGTGFAGLPLGTALLLAALGSSRAGAVEPKDCSSVLWLPALSSAPWQALEDTLARFPRARLTMALDPEEVPPQAKPRLAELVRQGRLEVALRLSGDPLLPLLQRNQPRDLLERLAAARARYRQIFGSYPTGFVPAQGALTPESAATLARAGLRWAATGETASAPGPWAAGGGLLVVGFHAVSSLQPARIKPGDPPRALVLDEAGGFLPPGSGPSLAGNLFDTGFFDSGAQARWGTVSEVFVWSSSAVPAPRAWPTWMGEDPLAPGEPARDSALALASQAAAQLDRYQNSGVARLDQLNKASAALYAAQASRYFAKGALADPALEREFRSRIRDVFKAVRQPLPEEMLALSDANASPGRENGGRPPPSRQADDELRQRVREGSAPGRLWFENPEGRAAGKPLTPGTTAQDLGGIRKLEVLWDKSSITFVVSMKKLLNAEGAPAGFSPLMLDLYVDVNHLPGRGATSLLPERRGFIRAADAWEYALVLTGFGGGLYRSGPGAEPALVERILPSSDLKRGEIKATLSRSRLRGNPAGWGYLLLALATDPGRARLDIPLPAPPAAAGQAGPVLGVLGDTTDQKLLSDPQGQFVRFSAVRVEKRKGER